MSQVDRVEMRFNGGDEVPELADYRPISSLVIVACIAGLMSSLAILHPLLWIVPVFAVILSVCAIRQVSTTQSRYGGRPAAVAALCLAVLIGSYAPMRAISLKRELYARAKPQVNQWLSLVQQGRYQEAHQFTLLPSERFQGPGPLADHYLPPVQTGLSKVNSMDPEETTIVPSASDELAAFLGKPVITSLVKFGEQGSIAHVQNISIGTAYGGNVGVTQRFRVSGVHDGQPGRFEFLVTSIRWETLGHANWQVGGFQEVLK